MRHHAHRAAVGIELAQQFHHRLAVLGIQVARRLVGQQDRRITRNGPRDGDTLLLAATQLCRVVLRAV